MEKEIQIIITKHYHEIKAQVEIEKVICGDIPALCDIDKIEYLEKLLMCYEKLFPFLKSGSNFK